MEAISAKIVIVGDGAIGKTCVMVRYHCILLIDIAKDILILTILQLSSKTELKRSILMVEKLILVYGILYDMKGYSWSVIVWFFETYSIS